jgi:hypothetical protein
MQHRRSSVALTLTLALAFAALGAGSVRAQTLHGRLVSADGAPTTGVQVRVRSGAFADSAAADGTGRFAIAVPAGSEPVAVRVGGGTSGFYAASARVPRAEMALEQGFVLVPRRWKVGAGRYAGMMVDVDLESAFHPSCSGCPAFLHFRGGRLSASRGRTMAWPAEHLPLRVAFDRDREGGPQLTAHDSASFWRWAGVLEATVGMPMFRPVAYANALPDEEGPGDVVLVRADPSLTDAGLTTVVAGENGIGYAAVRFQRAALLSDPTGQVVSHELLHIVGVGHTCSWPSVMAPLSCVGMRRDEPTPQDVAHVQLLLRMGELQRDPGLRFGLEEAVDAAGIERPAAPPPIRQASVRAAAAGPLPPPPERVRVIIPHGT